MRRFVPGCHATALVAVVAIGASGLSTAHALPGTPGHVDLASHRTTDPSTTSAGSSAFSAVSGDGNYVAFMSTGTDLVPGQVEGNNGYDVFLYERATGVVTLVSHVPDAPNTTANLGSSIYPRVSPDGSFVVFHSYASNLVEGQTGRNGNLFVFERATGIVELLSHTADSMTTGGGDVDVFPWPSISPDGTHVGFSSYAPDLVPGQIDTNGGRDVFLYERATRAISLVSHVPGSSVTTGDDDSVEPSVSAGGAYVAFTSYANNLVPRQRDAAYSTRDVFLFDRETGEIALVSHVPHRRNVTGDDVSDRPAVSADGAFVAFESFASDLVVRKGHGETASNVFLFERRRGAVTLVSHAAGRPTVPAKYSNGSPISISSDGAFVTFMSDATDLVAGQVDTNQWEDVFLYERATGDVRLVSHTADSPVTAGPWPSLYPSMSADGAYVAFMSASSNLVDGQQDPDSLDIFLFERATGRTTLVSHIPESATEAANHASGARPGGRGAEHEMPTISADGGSVAFVSLATNLVPNQSDINDGVDVFVFDRKGS